MPTTVWLVVLLACLAPVTAGGQVLTTVEFSFSNPGARSLGLGGAFVALADDATAAFANPAGLVQLTTPEVSIEGRSWRFTSPYTAGGRASGRPTGLGIDTIASPLRDESEAHLAGLSFLSLVYPVRNWSFAFYQHQLMNFELTQETQGLFAGTGVAGSVRGPIERGSFDLDVTSRALAAGIRVSDRLSLGFGLSHFDPDCDLVGDEFLPDDDTSAGYFARASFLPTRLLHRSAARTPGSDWGVSAGFLWSIDRDWKLGGVYREGPELDFDVTVTAGPADPDLPSGQRMALATSWSLPDVYGLGLSYRSSDGHWAAGLEWSRIEYSTVIDSLDPVLTSAGDTLSDADEIRLGVEYAFFVGTSVVAARLGAWHDPDHQVHNETGGPFVEAELIRGTDEVHVAAGVGIAIARFQIDFGIDLSDRRDTASLSAIHSF